MPPSQWTLPEQFDEYRLVRMLGRGSMGVVFLGHDLVLDRPVALKFLNAVDADARARERFLTEARAAARIQHPNVMAIYRVGELEGRLYIIGEYIRGQSLNELAWPLPWQEALKISVGLARGLACAHRMGVLHRDIKLANVMRNEAGEVKLLDFSLAKLLASAGEADPALTLTGPPAVPAARKLPQVVIDPGARGGRNVDPVLTAGKQPGAAAGAQGGARKAKLGDSSDATVVGTPYYMAPELWRGHPSSRATDVYALGVLLYILCCGRPPFEGGSTLELARQTQSGPPPPLRTLAPTVDERFAEIVDRCLRPVGARYPSADELCTALEALSLGAAPSEVVRGNPFRGLQAFEARHRGVFFGRGAEIREVVDRLRAEPFVLIAGDSGVGKSSLCRAGVLPVFTDQAIDRRTWSTISLMPGRRPLHTLVSALASTLSLQDEPLRELLAADPAELIRSLARRHGKDHGLILFVDQLEELVTLADRQQLQAVGRFLAELAGDVPGIRLLATVRGDFLTRVAALPHIGRHINAAIYLLTPLSREGVREAIVGPARLQDVSFDSEAVIEELVTAGTHGSLPLLQFALAELWEARDQATRKITIHDLERIGRVTGALARHADNVVAELPSAQRVAVRRLLMRLVTIEDTRASLPREDLVVGDQPQEAALEALVRGRLVVAREAPDGTVYEIAHEALIRSWGTLQRWVSEEREAREIRHRLEIAALEWQRLGGARVGLWSADQLAEAAQLEPDSLRPRELAFLVAGEAQVQRSRRTRLLALASVPVLVLALLIGFRVQQARDLAQRVDAQLRRADASLAEAQSQRSEASRARAHAFAQFDAMQAEQAEQTWALASKLAAAADRQYRGALQDFETVLSLDLGHVVGRERLADALLARALAAEETGRHELATELIERLPADSEQLARWNAPGKLSLRTTPPAPATIATYTQDPTTLRRTLGEARELGDTPFAELTLAQGSYQLSLRLADGTSVAYPFILRRGEALALDLTLPRPGSVPAGFVYIPEGRFLFGSPDDDLLRKFFVTTPQHEVRTDAYLIAQRETTYAEWLGFLRDLSPSERQQLQLGAGSVLVGAGISLAVTKGGLWSLSIAAGNRVYRAEEGQPIEYASRGANARQDWLRMPASGINYEDARAFVRWLDRTGRLPGARLCTDWEWERAARGADGRRYPHGDRLDPTDSNIDTTYDKIAENMGPDEVGSHPASRSPFGLDDAAGNVWEWVDSSLAPDDPVARGSSFVYDAVSAVLVNRGLISREMRDSTTGLRVCATPTP